jgi:hypothetical protein
MQAMQEESKNAHRASAKSVEQSTQNIELTRASVEALGKRLKTNKDESSGLELFCYIKCEPTDSRLLHECRGVVFHGEDLVLRAFPYTVEVAHTDEKFIEEHVQPVFKDCEVYDAYEGMLIRMFHFDGKWYTSTHRKLDANRSKWVSKESFGSLFVKTLEVELERNDALREAVPTGDESLLERFQSTLDTDKQYMFLVSHCTENRIVCAPPEKPVIFHV